MGQYERGLEQVRAGLALALEHNLSGAGRGGATSVWRTRSNTRGDYSAARQSYLTAADFCQTQGAEAVAQLCLACMTVVLRQTGEWERCAQVCREVLGSGAATRARPRRWRSACWGWSTLSAASRSVRGRCCVEAEREARQIELVAMELLSAWGLAMVDDLDGRVDSAADRCRGLLELWTRTEERHYASPRAALGRLAAGRSRAKEDLRACANALARIVAETGTAEAVAALGHALGEVCLVDGSIEQSTHHFDQALTQLDSLDLPYERAHTALRAGLAPVVAGERAAGIEHLADAYRRARSLGARPLAVAAARELARAGRAGGAAARAGGRLGCWSAAD